LGGMDRGHSFEELREFLKNVNLIISYGETKFRIDEFAADCDIECIVMDTLDQAVIAAYETTKRNSVVLLSPACASWDQFADFEARGNLFKNCVNSL
ncbi:MAG: UDP-N-acetylmuramoyl-L-alanine--D-glutamate ligase, partial [Clostridia bacterium]|nr:UDP-N-acetylmuramoyl-L-alanine--D-glutamate ligase [Clostridia bacterium]